MVLSLTKSYTPSAGQVANSTSYNTDIAALFNALSGLEAAPPTSSFGNLAIDAAGKLYLDGGGNSYITEMSADAIGIYVGGALGLTQTGTNTAFEFNVSLEATKKLYLDGGGNTYIYEASADNFYLVVGGVNTLSSTDVLVTFGVVTHNSGGTYIGLAAAASLLDDATAGAGSTTLYIGNSTIDVTAPSDASTKDNVTDAKVKADDLGALSVKEFKYKKEYGDENKKQIGLIAQEVEPFFPEAITLRSDGLKAVNYKYFIPVLLKAVQELTDRIVALEAK